MVYCLLRYWRVRRAYKALSGKYTLKVGFTHRSGGKLISLECCLNVCNVENCCRTKVGWSFRNTCSYTNIGNLFVVFSYFAWTLCSPNLLPFLTLEIFRFWSHLKDTCRYDKVFFSYTNIFVEIFNNFYTMSTIILTSSKTAIENQSLTQPLYGKFNKWEIFQHTIHIW